MDYQFPLSLFTGVYEDLTNPDNDLLGFFAQVDRVAVERIVAPFYSGLGPADYGAARYLALLLRVKQNIVSDRRLVADLRTNEQYRRAVGLGADPSAVPGRSALSAFRSRLGVEGFSILHRHFVQRAHHLGLTAPPFPGLPRNRREGIIAMVDATFLRARAHQHAKPGPDGEPRFTDLSVAFGRRHHIYRYAVGHKAHTLMAAGELPLLSVVAPANELDQNHLLPLLCRFRKLYPDMPEAYLLLDRGYDAEALYRAVYEDHGIIPITARKDNIAYPRGFSSPGRPLCPHGIEMARRGTDYGRRRTKFCCERRCRTAGAEPAEGWEECSHLRAAGTGLISYTRFEWGYRKFGPLTPDIGLFAHLYEMRTEIERSFGLKKSNRYRMEDTITVMGLDAVAIHVILHDTAIVIDCLQRAGGLMGPKLPPPRDHAERTITGQSLVTSIRSGALDSHWMFRQSVPALGLSLERATDSVPDDGLYYVILHGETVLVTGSKSKALSSYRRLLQQFGSDRSAGTAPDREEILRKLKAEADVSTLQAARSKAKRAHATHRRGGVSRWDP